MKAQRMCKKELNEIEILRMRRERERGAIKEKLIN